MNGFREEPCECTTSSSVKIFKNNILIQLSEISRTIRTFGSIYSVAYEIQNPKESKKGRFIRELKKSIRDTHPVDYFLKSFIVTINHQNTNTRFLETIKTSPGSIQLRPVKIVRSNLPKIIKIHL